MIKLWYFEILLKNRQFTQFFDIKDGLFQIIISFLKNIRQVETCFNFTEKLKQIKTEMR